MKLLFINDLKGNRQSYEFLTSQADQFDAMLWAGDLLDLDAGDSAEQQAFVERAAGEIQARGCRVLACGGENDHWAGPWLWLERQGMFVAPGLLVTTMPDEDVNRTRLAALRDATWNAGALWMVLSRGPVVPHLVVVDAPESVLLRPRPALEAGPDVIISSEAEVAGSEVHDWCEQRGQTWILTPGRAESDDFPAHIVFDTFHRSVTRYSPEETDRRDIGSLGRFHSTAESAQVVAA